MSDGRQLDREGVLRTMAAFRPACVLGAAAELDVFTALADAPATASELARRLCCDLRGIRTLLDALAALAFLEKEDDRYVLPEHLRGVLSWSAPDNVLPSLLHSANLVRRWSELAAVVKSGQPADRRPSVRGQEADAASFIAAMHTGSGPIADDVVRRIPDLRFTHLLDVGGASGSWTIAFLRAVDGSTATIFDLPHAIEQARERLTAEGLADRVRLVEGDFYRDELPAGADFAWVSAIAHQHGREDNRRLFAKVFKALAPGGRIGVRDMVMDVTRTRPLMGALFAINMLVGTAGGGTYTFEEFAEDLNAAGFAAPRLVIASDNMSSVVVATKP
jgi:SAM-dependent methyltransferase